MFSIRISREWANVYNVRTNSGGPGGGTYRFKRTAEGLFRAEADATGSRLIGAALR